MNFSMNNFKIFLCILPIVIFGAFGKAQILAESLKEETIELGDYVCKIEYKQSKDVKSYVEGADIDCGGFPIEIVNIFKTGFSTTISEEHLIELLTEIGAEFNLGTDQAKFKANLELRNKFARESKYLKTKELSLIVRKSIKIDPLDCFHQRAIVIYDLNKVKVNAKKEINWGRDKSFPFEWEERVNSRTKIEAKYDENCKRTCEISSKVEPVKGVNGEPLWAYIPFKHQKIFVVPLYWGEDGRLVEPIDFLPENVQKEIKDSMRAKNNLVPNLNVGYLNKIYKSIK
jgi:hypothetical protein